MPPQSTSPTVLIIPLILNALCAPAPPTWPPVANAPEIVFQIAGDRLHHNLSSDPWLPPTDICSAHFGIANASTESSVLLLLLLSLPSQQDLPAHYHGSSNTKVRNNRTASWTSLPLEPGIYGAPPAGQEPVRSNYPFGYNISLDVGLFSLNNISMLRGIEHRRTNDHPAEAPALFGALCSQDGNGSFSPSIFQDGQKFNTREVARYRKSAASAQPRKLLGTHNHQQFLICKKDVVVTAAGIAIVSAVLAMLLCCTAGVLYWCTRMTREDHELVADLCPSGPRRYGHHELVAAAHGFPEAEKIGRGGFGPVYRGFLADQERQVAIKVMSQGSSSSVQALQEGMREFQAEVNVMTTLRHRNIVQLLGWCDGQQRGLMLVYELVPNGSLEKRLYDPQSLLSWSERYQIALGVGSAIQYLHTECEQCVLHGDIKPANILLDHSYSPKLGDFGLARLVDHGADPHTTQVVAGTPGYMDPEFVSKQRPCVESDIFSFGVVLLEIACGRRPTPQPNPKPLLLNWVRDMHSKNSILAAADRRLHGEFDAQQMRRVLVAGLWCAHRDQSQRPSIGQAMDLLRRQDAELPPLLDLGMPSPDAVRALEEVAYGDLSTEDSALESSSGDTAYHTSKDI